MAASALVRADDFYVDGRSGIDRPDYGGSSQTPWRTITYALSRIPTPVAPATHTLRIAGGQTYSAVTNGEKFPLAMRPGVALRGEGTTPWLDAPRAQTLSFDASVAFTASTRVENLGLRGSPLLLGSGSTEHSPAFVNCTFAAAGIEIYAASGATVGVRIDSCVFTGGSQGLLCWVAGGSTTDVVVAPHVVDSEFRGQGTAGIYVDHGHDGPARTRVDLRVERCRFADIGRGLLVVDEPAQDTRNDIRVVDCAFRAVRLGVDCQAGRGGSFDSLAIEGCQFVAAGVRMTAIQVSGGRGSLALLRRNVIVGGDAGIVITAFPPFGDWLARTLVEDDLIVGTTVGFSVGASAQPARIDMARCRLLANDIGVRVSGDAPAGSTVNLGESVLAGGIDGLYLDTSHVVLAHGLTLADHRGAGVRALRLGAGSEMLHCVLSGNGTELIGSLPATYCAFRNQIVVGQGNLHADPLLLPPAYKLHPASPCIDAGTAAVALPATDYEGDPRLVAGPRGSLPDLGADEFVPAGGVRIHGVPGLGAGGMRPAIASPNRSARAGESVDVQVRDALDAHGALALAAFLCLGVDEVALDLAPLGVAGLLFTSPLACLPATAIDPRGVGTSRLSIPADTGLYGAYLHLQWMVLSPAAAELVTSDALRMTIGG